MGAVNKVLLTCDGCSKSAFRDDKATVGWNKVDRLSATSLDSYHEFMSESELYFCDGCSDELRLPWEAKTAPGRLLKKLVALIHRRPV